MRRTALLVDRRFAHHDTGRRHPESPARIEALCELFEAAPLSALPRVAARAATEEELRRVHDAAHVAAVAASAARPHTQFDADTPASSGSFDAALLAAGGAVAMADAILAGDVDNGFAALRPPGHHAEGNHPMGFCLFNNVAVVARHLTDARGLSRVLVVDWDVHHGNGTQHSFYDSDQVLYVSTHQYPFYPGTGRPEETGRGRASGYTVNVPMPAGCGDDEYLAAFRDLVLPLAREFAPEFVLVSAGYDAHRSDPLASMALSTAAFGAMTDALVEVADESARGRVLLLLEGGYDIEALKDSVATSIAHLADPAAFVAGGGELTAWGRLSREALAPYWETL
ncbi:MAG TPA: histone deacetylase [Candidatus Binatia bacterium]|jgi:acetoin utilization deacetylase AcuC-like enzyme